MKTIISLMALLFSLSTAFAQTGSNTADQVTGLYWSPKKDAKIEVYKKADKYFGKSIWVAAPRKDTENPVSALQSREVLGIELLTDFSFDSGVYKGGKIYDPVSGKTYSCKMNLEGNNLKVRGYIGISLFGRTEIFERIK
ncbi:MAG: DUF2147 domain-containing protein [Sediminibacterium sp.]